MNDGTDEINERAAAHELGDVLERAAEQEALPRPVLVQQPPAEPTTLPTHTSAAGETFRVSAPLRPDLLPGEVATSVPDRYCDRCQEARGGRRCPVCRALTRPNDLNPGEDMSIEAQDELARSERVARVPVQYGPRGGRNVMPPDDDEGDMLPRLRSVEPDARAAPRHFGRGPVPPPQAARAPSRAERSAPVMSRGRNQQRYQPEYDDDGREMHFSGSRRPKNPLDQLDAFRMDAKVNDDHWVEMHAAWIASGLCVDGQGNPSPELAADLADHSYAQLIERQQMAGARRGRTG